MPIETQKLKKNKFKSDCIFCQIAQKKVPAHIIWEDAKYIAFLSIFPNTKGFTVVATKEHWGSDPFQQPDEILAQLVLASKKVAQILVNYFDDVGRCGMFFEGWGVDHLHAKLYPMHGTGKIHTWKPIESQTFKPYFHQYPGYLCSNDSARADDKKLADLAKKIRQSY